MIENEILKTLMAHWNKVRGKHINIESVKVELKKKECQKKLKLSTSIIHKPTSHILLLTPKCTSKDKQQ